MNLARFFVLLVAALLPFCDAIAHSQTMSPNAAADCTSPGGGGQNWTNPGNAFSNNATRASVVLDDNQVSDPLQCVDYRFTIPATATILGIEVSIERRASSAAATAIRDNTVFLMKAGAAVGSNGATATNYPVADTVEVHGSPTQLWGTTWTPAEINDANFGVVYTAIKPGATAGTRTVEVDHISITVYYSQAPPAPTLVSPAHQAIVADSTPTFDWTDVVDPDGDTLTYEIQADTGGCTFPAPALNQTGIAASTFTPGAALANGNYCWRARAVDVHGMAGPWSATRVVSISVSTSQTMSPNAAADCTSLGGGGQNWTNPGNAFSSNNTRATVTLNDNQVSDPLQCLDYRFTIPTNAVIQGIEVSIERRASSAAATAIRDDTVFLVKAGAAVGSNGATATNYPTGDTVEVHGSPTQLWGTTWTPAEINDANFGVVYTAIKPGATAGTRTVDVDHISITVHFFIPFIVPTPGGFNAFESSTAASATLGVINTKVAGSAFSLDVVAVSGSSVIETFTDLVIVELLGNNTLGIALDASNCPVSSTTLQTVAPNPTITYGRSTVNFSAVANSWRDVRVRVRWPTTSPTAASCSTDNFAIRPASFAASVTDNDWSSAGTNRILGNTGASGGAVHKAGQNFTLTVTPAPATATNYTGDPTVSALACTLPAGCVNGLLAPGTFSSIGAVGERQSITATYSEAGAFNLTLVDQNYASVDASDGTPADCSAAGRYVCQSSAPLAVGRFVPDRFEFVSPSAPALQTFGSSCASRSFTYLGQPFWYASGARPSATIQAVNAGGNVTANYTGTLFKLAAAGVVEGYSSTPAGIDSAMAGTAVLGTPGAGVVTYTAASGGTLAYARSATTPVVPFNAQITLTVNASDSSENGPGHGIVTSPVALVFNGGGSGIAFDAGAEFRYGQARLLNASGPLNIDLPVTLRTEYFASAGFLTNAADHCSSFAANNFLLSNHQAGLSAGNMGASHVSISGAVNSGIANLRLTKPSPLPTQPGRVRICLDLGADAATPGTPPCVATSAAQAWLQGRWSESSYDDDPSATAAFGLSSQPNSFIFFRENY